MGVDADSLKRTGQIRYKQLKGRAFEGVLVLATLVGLVALVILFGYIFLDAFGPFAADLRWYLLFFATLVAPVSAFTLYARRHSPVRRANARAAAAVFGGLAFALASFVVIHSVNPYGVLVYLLTMGVPPLVIAAYARYTSESTFAGPAIVVATIMGAVWTFGSEDLLFPPYDALVWVGNSLLAGIPVIGSLPVPFNADIHVTLVSVGLPTLVVALGAIRRRSIPWAVAVPVVAAISAGGTIGLDRFVRPPLEILAIWLTYVGLYAVPIAGIAGVLVARRRTRRSGILATGLAIAGALAVGGVGLALGVEPSIWVVLYASIGIPLGYVAWQTLAADRAGVPGLAGPFVILGGVGLGVVLESALNAAGPATWVTPTLLLNAWNGIDPTKAGAYPSIVGSIMIVTVMALLAFPVGIGAAIYLEEYAPDTGTIGRLANLLEINIANLAGVPSVVYGLLGLALFNNALNLDPGIVLAASATLGLLILPIVIVSAQEAIRSVPDSLRQASYGMGASRWQTLRRVVLPEAVPGILTGTILALGRAIGETAPLIIIAVPTTTFTAPDGLLSSGAALPLKIFSASANAIPAYRKGVVAALAVVLLVLMLTMNAIAIVIRNRYQSER